MAKKFDTILSRALVNKGLIKETALEAILKEIAVSGETLASALLKQGVTNEETVLNIFAEKLEIPYINLKESTIDKEVIDKVPVKFAGYYKCMPLKIKDKVLTIASSYPLDVKIHDEISMSLEHELEVVLALESDISEAIKKHYGVGAETIEGILSQTPKERTDAKELLEEKVEDIEKLAQESSVIKLVNQIILDAYKKRATDIHIEPYRNKMKLRYRIDGVLYSAPVPVEIKNFLSPILSRIKIMSNLNIVERRLPQDGRAKVKTQEQTIDLRISFIPTAYGESVVIRILPMKRLFSLERLGLLPSDLKIFEDLMTRPHGIIFVSGPTGSGKTTTLYTCLSKINTDKRKIVTIEDPIEYEMEGITQIQVMPGIGLDFARGLRSMLRHDPDVMMVGEVRDSETAEIAIRVALTGHLVFSTLHTNDAASGIIRLIDIGVEPYLVASSVEAFIAQRLVRVICPNCKEQDRTEMPEVRSQIAEGLRMNSQDEVKIYRGKGCQKCNFTGFYGRTAIYEILFMDEVIKDLILKRATSEQIKKAAMLRGMRSLRQDGWQKVISGLTTPDEVMKVAQAEKVEFTQRKNTNEVSAKAVKEEINFSGHKRVFIRLDNKIKLHYKIKAKGFDKDGKIDYLSNTENISAGGLLFVSNKSLPLGSILALKIELPDGNEPVECLSRLLRIEEIVVNKIYDIAVCFLDITGAERMRVNKYVQQELGEGEKRT